MKRRFAKYIKSHIASDEKETNSNDQKFYRLPFLDKYRIADKEKPSTSTKSPTNGSYIQTPAMHVVSGIDHRHRSPDPPPRYNRGQSPLILRRNLLNQASGSPIFPRR